MPSLWKESVAAHRQAVRDAILDTVASLAARNGPLSLTMSQIAEETGIGRATLYKYFSDVEEVLLAWHAREVARNLERLAAIKDRPGTPVERLAAVLETYAFISHEHHGNDLTALLHRGEHAVEAERRLSGLVEDLLTQGVRTGDFRDDVPAAELAAFCLAALSAASGLTSEDAVRRLVTVTMSGCRG